MSNKIISFTEESNNLTSETNTSSLVLYRDISLDSLPSKITYFTETTISGNMGYLLQEDPDSYDHLCGLILQDDGLSCEIRLLSDYQRIKVFSHEVSNQYNINLNEDLRKRSPYKIDTKINVNAVKLSIRNIFSWIPGERILNPEFGSNLRKYLYEGITEYNTEKIMSEIRRCFIEWEPRAKLVTVVDVSDVADTEDNTVCILIIYMIPELSDEQYSYLVEVETSNI